MQIYCQNNSDACFNPKDIHSHTHTALLYPPMWAHLMWKYTQLYSYPWSFTHIYYISQTRALVNAQDTLPSWAMCGLQTKWTHVDSLCFSGNFTHSSVFILPTSCPLWLWLFLLSSCHPGLIGGINGVWIQVICLSEFCWSFSQSSNSEHLRMFRIKNSEHLISEHLILNC